MGNHLRAEGRMELAERMWKRSLKLRPHPRIYANLAQVSLDEGRLTDAMYYSNKGLELDSTQAALWTHLGQVYMRLGDYNNAVASQQRAITLDPNDPVYYHNHAITLGLMQDWTGAERYEREALSRMPNDLKAMLGLCVALINQGKLEESEGLCQRMMAINPVTPDPYLYLAQIYSRRNQDDRARAVLNGYLQAFPTSPAVPRISQMLDELNRPAPDSTR
jgi:Flp pilus assembly protein TadD